MSYVGFIQYTSMYWTSQWSPNQWGMLVQNTDLLYASCNCTSHSDQWGNWGMARLNGAFEIAHCITKEPRQLKQIPCNRNAQFGIVRATMRCNGSEPMFQRFDLHVYYCAHHFYRITSDKRLLSTSTSILRTPPLSFLPLPQILLKIQTWHNLSNLTIGN